MNLIQDGIKIKSNIQKSHMIYLIKRIRNNNHLKVDFMLILNMQVECKTVDVKGTILVLISTML